MSQLYSIEQARKQTNVHPLKELSIKDLKILEINKQIKSRSLRGYNNCVWVFDPKCEKLNNEIKEELKNAGYKVKTEIEKPWFIQIRISW